VQQNETKGMLLLRSIDTRKKPSRYVACDRWSFCVLSERDLTQMNRYDGGIARSSRSSQHCLIPLSLATIQRYRWSLMITHVYKVKYMATPLIFFPASALSDETRDRPISRRREVTKETDEVQDVGVGYILT